jgi:hypothetical protein
MATTMARGMWHREMRKEEQLSVTEEEGDHGGESSRQEHDEPSAFQFAGQEKQKSRGYPCHDPGQNTGSWRMVRHACREG